MQKKRSTFLVLILVLALLCACGKPQADPSPAAGSEPAVPAAGTDAPADEPAPDEPSGRVPDRTLRAAHYTADVFSLPQVRQYGCTLEGREYVTGDGVTVRMFRASGGAADSVCTYYDKTLPEGTTIHYYTAGNQWVHGGLSEGTCAARFIYLEQPGGASTILILPRTYTLRENDTLEYHPDCDGTLSISKTSGGWRVTMRAFGLASGRVADCMSVTAAEPLLTWDDEENLGDVWGYHTRSLAAKWCYTGYFRQTPDNYIPTGENYYYRCAASYLIRDTVKRIPWDKAAAALSVAMLDTMAQQQNSYGYWPTTPGSEWLQGVPRHRLGGRNGQLIGMISEHRFDSGCFAAVVQMGRCAMGVDIANLLRQNTTVCQCQLHAGSTTGTARCGCSKVVGITVGTITYNFCINFGTASFCRFQFLQQKYTAALSHNKPAALCIKRDRGTCRVFGSTEGFHAGKATYTKRADAAFSTAAEHPVLIAVPDTMKGITDSICATCTSSGRTAAHSL